MTLHLLKLSTADILIIHARIWNILHGVDSNYVFLIGETNLSEIIPMTEKCMV
jgi:hypothetical protein